MVIETILFVLQWLLAAVGIVGNIWVIVAITRYNAIKRTANKIMFINLAIADMGVLLVRNAFFFLYRYFDNRWVFGKFTCRIIMPFSLIFMPASILTLVAISYSRCRAIVYIKQFKEISVRKTWCIVALIWAFVAIFYPGIEIFVRRLDETAQNCYLDISPLISHVLYAFEDFYFALSLVVIIVMFIRMRRSLLAFSKVYNDSELILTMMKNVKALKLLWPVVIALFVTMVPFLIGRIWYWVKGDDKDIPVILVHVIDVLHVTNSAINPFIYIIVSTEFRQRILQITRWRLIQVVWSKPHARHQTREMPLCAPETHDNILQQSKV